MPISHSKLRSEQNSSRNTDERKMRVSGGEGARPHPHPRAAHPICLPVAPVPGWTGEEPHQLQRFALPKGAGFSCSPFLLGVSCLLPGWLGG